MFIDQYTVMGLARVFLTDITVKLGETLGKSGTTRVYRSQHTFYVRSLDNAILLNFGSDIKVSAGFIYLI